VKPVGEVPLTQIEPDPFHRVQFRGVGWQPQERDVLWDGKIEAGVPPGSVEHHDGVLIGREPGAERGEEQRHSGGADLRQHEADIPARGGLHGSEDVDRGVSVVDDPARTLAAQPPMVADAPSARPGPRSGRTARSACQDASLRRVRGGQQLLFELGRAGLRIGIGMHGADLLS